MFEEENGDLEQDSDSEQGEKNDTGPKSEATIKIHFGSSKYADIARKVLEVDKPHFHERQFLVEGEYLITQIGASSAKGVRNAISAFFDQMMLCKETIERFSTDSEENVKKVIVTKSDAKVENKDTILKSEEKEKNNKITDHVDNTTLTSTNSG